MAPPTKMTGTPPPTRSNAIVVPSLDFTVLKEFLQSTLVVRPTLRMASHKSLPRICRTPAPGKAAHRQITGSFAVDIPSRM